MPIAALSATLNVIPAQQHAPARQKNYKWVHEGKQDKLGKMSQ
jgi:hypothetical protein